MWWTSEELWPLKTGLSHSNSPLLGKININLLEHSSELWKPPSKRLPCCVFPLSLFGSRNNLCNFLTLRTTGYMEVPNPMSKVSIWKHWLHLKYSITGIGFSEVRYCCKMCATMTEHTQRSRESMRYRLKTISKKNQEP